MACDSAKPMDFTTLIAILAASDAAAAFHTARYLRAFEAGNPIPPPRSDAAHRAVRRYDTSDPEPKTLFHSKRPAPLPVAAVFENLAKRVPTFDAATGLVAAVLMLRFQRASGLPLTTAMLHRLYLACLVVAAKAHHDAVAKNSAIAKLSGVSTSELNRLEAELLRALDFRCLVTAEQVEAAVLLLTEPDSPCALTLTCSDDASPLSVCSESPEPETAQADSAPSLPDAALLQRFM
uniref:Cyclin N-terminal domain-containing protein n=1 Tax=Neobodo designis TaxID=312471 RepID=A0A7S1LS72_NEODS